MITKNFQFQNPYVDGDPVYDFDALESLEEFRSLAEPATCIAYKCSKSSRQGLVFGVAALRAIAQEVLPPQKMVTLVFVLDSRSMALEKLVAAVQAVKGFDEYESLGGAR